MDTSKSITSMDTDKTNINDNITKLAEKFADDFVKDGLVNEDGTIPMSEWKNMSGELKFDPKEWKVTEEWSKPLSFTPDYTIKLNKHDKVIGCLDFNGDKLKFEGDVEESAKIFFDFLLSSFNQRIEEIKSEAIKEYNEQFDPRED